MSAMTEGIERQAELIAETVSALSQEGVACPDVSFAIERGQVEARLGSTGLVLGCWEWGSESGWSEKGWIGWRESDAIPYHSMKGWVEAIVRDAQDSIAARALAPIRAMRMEVDRAEQRWRDLVSERDDLIRTALAAGARPRDVVAATGLSRERVYQIKDGRR